jgi:hypothetical protein
MYLQNCDNVYDLVWTYGPDGAPVTYGDVYHQNEVEQSAYNFEHADVAELFHRFDACEREAQRLVELGLPLPAYEQVTKASHAFNLLDARRAISVTERQRYILRVRALAAVVLVTVFFADYLMSHFVMKMVKDGVDRSVADNTEAISREIRVLLSNKTVFHRRFAEAYPEVIYRTERVVQRMERVRAETERLRRLAEQRAEDMGSQLAATLEPTALIKNDLIEKQGALIRALYDEEAATDEQRVLKREIDRRAEKLSGRRERGLLLP